MECPDTLDSIYADNYVSRQCVDSQLQILIVLWKKWHETINYIRSRGYGQQKNVGTGTLMKSDC